MLDSTDPTKIPDSSWLAEDLMIAHSLDLSFDIKTPFIQ
jgi:hypothetical protein